MVDRFVFPRGKSFSQYIFVISLVFIIITAGCMSPRQPAVNIQLPVIFNHDMVLQQQVEVPVWGTADPGGQILIEIAGQQQTAIVDENGQWQTELEPLSAGGPHELVIIGKDTINFKNIMVGEVWLCSGQSNMEMPLAGWGKILDYEKEIAGADYPNIRLFKVEHTKSMTPQSTINSDGWKPCSPATIPEFSSTAYFFGRELYKNLDIPIGLIQSSWGGTVVEAWTSAKSLRENPDFAELVQGIESGEQTEENYWEIYREKLSTWDNMMQRQIDSLGGYDHGWDKPEFNTAGWKNMNLPTIWENAGLDVDGLVWFRKEVNLPETWQGKDLTLSLGPINDFDVTFFNGNKVGSEAHHEIPRNYNVPGPLVKSGRNVIAVQVLDFGNKGGIYGKSEQLNLSNESLDSISLQGNWKYHTDTTQPEMDDLPPLPTIRHSANRPTVLFNGMISPLIPFGINGVIWYQGESNADRAHQYRTIFRTHIQDWRMHWNKMDLPFLFVQLANFKQRKPEPADDDWAELREAQLMTLSLPNTGMAVAIDIGDADDIHPKNKQDVGKRLALNALNLVYKKDIVSSGPVYKSMKVEENKIRLFFDHIDGGLVSHEDSKLEGFAIAGSDKKFIWAEAEIEEESIIVWNNNITNPVAVRYGWAANPSCNLYNKSDLPATPFRTDSWTGITEGKK